MYNINDLYNTARLQNLKLLSDYNTPFWAEYIANNSHFDALFRRKFYSFVYFLQSDDETVSTVTNNFIADIKNHLIANNKRYSELWRVNVIDDDKYSLTDNYDATETMTRTTTANGTQTNGERTDTTTDTIGEKLDTTTHSIDARTDTTADTIGEHTVTNNENYGAVQNSQSTTVGTHTDTLSHSVAPYDSDVDKLESKDTNVYGAHTDTSTSTDGARVNTITTNNGGQNNSSTATTGEQSEVTDVSQGEQTNTSNTSIGSQTNTTADSSNENYTMTRKGNIGVMTVSDMLDKHITLWSKYDFYNFVFDEIARELLLVDGGLFV